MQGYIISLNRAKDEDLIITILSENGLDTLYRFYGARHGVINLGFKIDFEIVRSLNSSMGQLRDVVHLGYPWLLDRHRLQLWQQFVVLFYTHLKASEESGDFYFKLLDHAADRWHRQNPKRVAVELYITLLHHEGRLHKELRCFFCDQPIIDKVSLIRSFLPAHPHCTYTLSIERAGFIEMVENHSTLFLSDKEVESLWLVLLEGI